MAVEHEREEKHHLSFDSVKRENEKQRRDSGDCKPSCTTWRVCERRSCANARDECDRERDERGATILRHAKKREVRARAPLRFGATNLRHREAHPLRSGSKAASPGGLRSS